MPSCLRSEEHTSELQSHLNLVCRLLLEKKTYRRRGRLAHRSTAPPTECLSHSPHSTHVYAISHPRAHAQTPVTTHPHLLPFFLNNTPTPKFTPLPLHAAVPI